jgi:hypothetical protein
MLAGGSLYKIGLEQSRHVKLLSVAYCNPYTGALGMFLEICVYAVAMLAINHSTTTKRTNTMPCPSWQTALTNGIVISGVLIGGTNWTAQSQPIADDTLGNERSVVVPLEANTPGDRCVLITVAIPKSHAKVRVH